MEDDLQRTLDEFAASQAEAKANKEQERAIADEKYRQTAEYQLRLIDNEIRPPLEDLAKTLRGASHEMKIEVHADLNHTPRRICFRFKPAAEGAKHLSESAWYSMEFAIGRHDYPDKMLIRTKPIQSHHAASLSGTKRLEEINAAEIKKIAWEAIKMVLEETKGWV